VGIGNTTDFILFLFSTPFYFPILIFGPRFDSPDLPQSLSNWSGGHNLLFLCFWFRNLSQFRLLLSFDPLLSFVSTVWTHIIIFVVSLVHITTSISCSLRTSHLAVRVFLLFHPRGSTSTHRPSPRANIAHDVVSNPLSVTRCGL